MALHVFAATSGNFWEAPRAAIAVKKKRSIGVNGVVATLSLYGSGFSKFIHRAKSAHSWIRNNVIFMKRLTDNFQHGLSQTALWSLNPLQQTQEQHHTLKCCVDCAAKSQQDEQNDDGKHVMTAWALCPRCLNSTHMDGSQTTWCILHTKNSETWLRSPALMWFWLAEVYTT